MRVIRVAVPSPLRRSFDYLPPEGHQGLLPAAGCRVSVPFGQRRLIGVVLGSGDESAVHEDKLRPVHEVIDETPLLPPAMLHLLMWAAEYYHHPIGEVFAAALPARLRRHESVAEKPQAAEQRWRARPLNEATEEAEAAALRRAPRQAALHRFIQEQGEVSRQELTQAGFTAPLLRSLEEKGLIESRQVTATAAAPFTPLSQPPSQALVLNPEQEAAVAAISEHINGFHAFLLDGVTGSGKTEVYMQAMAEVLQQGRQCLILVPEIGLTPQTVRRFSNRFAEGSHRFSSIPVVTLHSGLGEAERLAAWRKAASGAAGIVIGTRSAVFTPLARPGLIVVDEEHDGSFKQQDRFRYSARDLAVVRAQQENICVVLGSATPSLESVANAASGRFSRLVLSHPAGAIGISRREVVDISASPTHSGLSETLLDRIQSHLRQGNQVLVFINRRGFAPVLSCAHCGWLSECENCIAYMTVHAVPRRLRCHHCGESAPLPRVCPACKQAKLQTQGTGTQQLEHILKTMFKPVPVLRIDSDSARSRKRLDAMLSEIHKGQPCILLGTQMLAKGHHFPAISLVAVVNADSGLFSADFRGQEFMSQTVLQVAGRAGRAQLPGEVIIQSQHATHPAVQALATDDYASIAQQLLAERQRNRMPPFSHLCLLRADYRLLPPCLDFLSKAAALARQYVAGENGSDNGGQPKVQIIGPLPPPMEKRAGRLRAQLLLRSEHRAHLQHLLGHLAPAMEAIKKPNTLRWSIDVDPLDMV